LLTGGRSREGGQVEGVTSTITSVAQTRYLLHFSFLFDEPELYFLLVKLLFFFGGNLKHLLL